MYKEEVITRVAEKIKNQYNPERIIIFGSYAWGKPAADSDLDLFIVKQTNQKHRQRALEIRRMLREENELLGMDILVFTPEELAKRLEIKDSFISKIIEKGRIIYG